MQYYSSFKQGHSLLFELYTWRLLNFNLQCKIWQRTMTEIALQHWMDFITFIFSGSKTAEEHIDQSLLNALTTP